LDPVEEITCFLQIKRHFFKGIVGPSLGSGMLASYQQVALMRVVAIPVRDFLMKIEI